MSVTPMIEMFYVYSRVHYVNFNLKTILKNYVSWNFIDHSLITYET